MHKKILAGVFAAITAVMLTATAAYAQVTPPEPYSAADAVTDSTGFIGTLTEGIVPVMLAVAGGIVGLVVLSWGLKTVFRKVRGAARV